MRRWGWPKVRKSGEGVLQQLHRVSSMKRFCPVSATVIGYSLLSVFVRRRHSPMEEWAGHCHIVVELVKPVQIVF
jgi:hypothetical protein